MPLSTSAYQSCTGSQCSRGFSQGKPVAPLIAHAGFNKLCSAFSALSENQNSLATLHAVQGRGKLMHYQHVVPGAVPTGLPSTFGKAASMFFWFLGYQLFYLAKRIPVKTLSESPIFKSMPFPKRA